MSALPSCIEGGFKEVPLKDFHKSNKQSTITIPDFEKKSTVWRYLLSAAVHAMGENSAGATSGRSGLSGRPTTASRSAAASSGSSQASAEERIDAELKIERWQLRNYNEALRSELQELRQQQHAERKVAYKACKKLNNQVRLLKAQLTQCRSDLEEARSAGSTVKALAEENCALRQGLEGLREALVATGQQSGAGAARVTKERLDGRLEFNGFAPDRVVQFKTRWPSTPSPD